MNSAWIEAAKILSVNPTSQVKCPECSNSYLEVSDQYIPGQQIFERFIKCPKCNGSSILRMTYKPTV